MSENEFPSRVTLCEDGVYRWSYDMDMYRNPYLRSILLKVMGVLCAVMYVFLLALIAGGGRGLTPRTMLLAALPFSGLLLLTLLIYYICAAVMHGTYHLRFEMDEDAVRLVRKLLSSDGAPLPSSSLIENIVRIAIWALGGSFILSACFGIDVGGLVAALGVGGVALSLGLQDTISNFIGGLQVTLMKIVQPGDHVKIGTTEGMVLDVNWRQTTVKDFENTVHTIPNSSINKGEVEQIDPPHLVSTLLAFTNDTRDIDETIRKVSKVSPSGAWLTATLGTMKTGQSMPDARAGPTWNFRLKR